MSLQNRQLRTTLPAIKLQANSETVKVSPQTRQKHSRYDPHAKEPPLLLATQPVRLQDPQTKIWSISGEVLSRAETPHVKTPKGLLRWKRIQIKEVPLPVNPTAPTIESSRPPHITDVLRIAAKPPSPQSTVQPRIATKPPSIQHTPSAGNTNQQELSTPRSTQDVQISIPQPHSVLSDKPIKSPGSSDNNKASPKVSVPKPPDLVQRDTSSLRRSSRVSQLNRKYIDIVTLVFANGLKNHLKTFSLVNWLPFI